MTRSKEEKAAFIAHLRKAAEELGATNPTIPPNIATAFSPMNALMIILQKPKATHVAGFHAWKAAGRTVRKGAKGAAILVPLGVGDDDKPRFSWRYVFDVSDTDTLTQDSPATLRELVGA